jgi:hypothetical protein
MNRKIQKFSKKGIKRKKKSYTCRYLRPLITTMIIVAICALFIRAEINISLHIHLCNAPLSFSFSLNKAAKIENLIINANYSTNLYNSFTRQVEINSNRIETSHSVSIENQAQANNETTPKRKKSTNSETKPRLINNTIAKRDRRYKYPFKDKLLLLIAILSLISIPETLSWENYESRV